jgi:two-component system, chemotaxis family, CheB/CheR fusion protein
MVRPCPRVAIVDDDIAVLDATRFLLEALGQNVQTFTSPAEFLVHARLGAFDRLISDQDMPGMTGIELAHHLRSRGVHIPTMLVTGSLTDTVARRAAELELENVVEKPASEADLMRFIDTPTRCSCSLG